MHTYIIVNPHAGSAEEAHAVARWAGEREGVVYRESAGEAAVRGLVREAIGAGAEQIVAAGGDGTINLVVNALLRTGADMRLGVLPLGTGNDLARTLELPLDMFGALAALEAGREIEIDVFRAATDDVSRYGVNVAAGGFSGQVDEALTPEVKAAWGPLAYVLGVAQVLPDLKHYETYVAVDDKPRRRVEALNIVVANGRTAGGGHAVAPTANPCDGLLDVVIVKWGPAAELAEVGTRLVADNYMRSPLVSHQRAQRVTVASTPGMWFNVDGELLTNQPLTFEVLPRRLRVVVGAEFTPDAASR